MKLDNDNLMIDDSLKYSHSYLTVAMAAYATATTTCAITQDKMLDWRIIGDGCNDCNCDILCPCEFVQTPTYEDCDGILAHNIKKGNYGEITLHGLYVLVSASFKDNTWSSEGTTKVDQAFLFDEKEKAQQREDPNLVFSGNSYGFTSELAIFFGRIHGMECSTSKSENADDLSCCSAKISGKILAKTKTLTGTTAPLNKSPNNYPLGKQSTTWLNSSSGGSLADEVEAIVFNWKRKEGQQTYSVRLE